MDYDTDETKRVSFFLKYYFLYISYSKQIYMYVWKRANDWNFGLELKACNWMITYVFMKKGTYYMLQIRHFIPLCNVNAHLFSLPVSLTISNVGERLLKYLQIGS